MIVEVWVVDKHTVRSPLFDGFVCPNGHAVTGTSARSGEPAEWHPCGCWYSPTHVQAQLLDRHARRPRRHKRGWKDLLRIR